MKKQTAALEEWRPLYDASIALKKLAPWEWMEEIDVFGVQHPDTGEIGFVSVMGMEGEHYAVGVYRGTKALYQFWDLQEHPEDDSPERILEISQLQASFEDRNNIGKDDYAIIKDLGFRFRGKRAWPQFRSIQPGCLPWFLEADDVYFLRHILEQTVDVASRYDDDPELLYGEDDDSYLVRVPTKNGDEIVWEDQVMRIQQPEPEGIRLAMDVKLLQSLKNQDKTGNQVEIDLFMFPNPVKEDEGPPFFPYIVLMVDAQSQMILGTEMLQPLPSLHHMRGLVPNTVVATLAKAGIFPKKIRVRSGILHTLLLPVAEDLDIELKQVNKLVYLDPVKQELFTHFL